MTVEFRAFDVDAYREPAARNSAAVRAGALPSVDRSTFPVDVGWAKIAAPAAEGFIFIARDGTERLTREGKLRERDNTALARATRFVMLGELASAITHELSQPIGSGLLRTCAQILAAPFAKQDGRLAQTLAKTNSEGIRASGVLRGL